jgi:hypothetical protein
MRKKGKELGQRGLELGQEKVTELREKASELREKGTAFVSDLVSDTVSNLNTTEFRRLMLSQMNVLVEFQGSFLWRRTIGAVLVLAVYGFVVLRTYKDTNVECDGDGGNRGELN